MNLAKILLVALATFAVTPFAPGPGGVAQAAEPDVSSSLLRSGAPRAITFFPAPLSAGNAFRQVVPGVCAAEVGTVFCRYTFSTVPAQRLVRIDNVTCATIVEATDLNRFFVLTNSPGLTARPIAFIPGDQETDTGSTVTVLANASGPYYFRAGETPIIVSGGVDIAGVVPHCTLSGTQFPTN